MKKIIKSSIAVLGICFIATAANAQLASEMPAASKATAQKSTTVNAVEVQTASSMPAAKPVAAKVATPATDAAATLSSDKAAVAASSQGTEAAVAAQPASEAKLPAVSTQGAAKAVKEKK